MQKKIIYVLLCAFVLALVIPVTSAFPVVQGTDMQVSHSDSVVHNKPRISGDLVIWNEWYEGKTSWDLYAFNMKDNTTTPVKSLSACPAATCYILGYDVSENRVVWSLDDEILLYDFAKRNLTRITTISTDNHCISPAIDGDRVAYTCAIHLGEFSWSPSQIYVYDIGSGAKELVVKNPYNQSGWGPSSPEISGDHLFYGNSSEFVEGRRRLFTTDIWMKDLTTGTNTLIASNKDESFDSIHHWASTKNWVIWSSTPGIKMGHLPDHYSRIYSYTLYDITNRTKRTLFPPTLFYTRGYVDIDNNTVVFFGAEDPPQPNSYYGNVYLYDIPTATIYIFPDTPRLNQPTISGNRIAAVAQRGGNDYFSGNIHVFTVTNPPVVPKSVSWATGHITMENSRSTNDTTKTGSVPPFQSPSFFTIMWEKLFWFLHLFEKVLQS